jgi:hypothetical protein
MISVNRVPPVGIARRNPGISAGSLLYVEVSVPAVVVAVRSLLSLI